MHRHHTFVVAALLCAALPLAAAPGDQPVKPLPPSALAPAKTDIQTKSATLPARGLFDGDKLTPAAQQRLADLIVDALGLQVDVALIVPTGPWKTDGAAGPNDERALTPARLEAVKRFLTQRGLNPKHIYVESRLDEKVSEPRLEVQIAGRPAVD